MEFSSRNLTAVWDSRPGWIHVVFPNYDVLKNIWQNEAIVKTKLLTGCSRCRWRENDFCSKWTRSYWTYQTKIPIWNLKLRQTNWCRIYLLGSTTCNSSHFKQLKYLTPKQEIIRSLYSMKLETKENKLLIFKINETLHLLESTSSLRKYDK